MKILHISTRDKGGGGGSFDASYRLHRNMLSAGIDSRMLVLNKVSNDAAVFNISAHFMLMDKLKYYWFKMRTKINVKVFGFSRYFYADTENTFSAKSILERLSFSPDVIIAHWISGFMTSGNLSDLNRVTGAPVLWYFMDMAPMTGGCHYMLDCDGFTRECGYCPQLGRKNGKEDISHKQWKRKRSYVQSANITPVLASSWQEKKIRASSVFHGKRSAIIPLGIDPVVFCPKEQTEARKLLGLPTSRKILFFGAMNTHEERKGAHYLVKALELLYEMLYRQGIQKEILIVTAGKKENTNNLDIKFEHCSIGFLRGDAELASAYQAADIFICSSIEDAGPMMINESIMCGTPVVSFDMGIAMDIVHTRVTGYRARLRDVEDMAAGLFEILDLDEDDYQMMRKNCRSYGLKVCHPNVQVQAFKSLCVELLNDKQVQRKQE